MDLKQAIKDAIRGEVEGRELYTAIAEKTDDAGAKEVFRHLAAEEDRHFKFLKALYGEFLEGKPISVEAAQRILGPEQLSAPIFSEDFKTRAMDHHFEMSALSIAMRLERDSAKFYGEMASEAQDPAMKAFFQDLSAWEQAHYDALAKEVDALQEEYFESNYFAPY